MRSPLGDDGFHPEDPTKWLWKKLLRSKPIIMRRAPKSKAEKRSLAIKLQEYYTDRPHPRKGKPFKG